MAEQLEKLFAATGIAMTAVLLTDAITPLHRDIAPGLPHYVAHLATFAALATVWTLSLPRIGAFYLAAALIAFGFLHEGIEILGHHHSFELYDALTDAAGVILGIGFARRIVPHRERTH